MTERPPRINVPLMIASLAMSISLWAVVYAQNTPTRTAELNARIELQGYDESRFAVMNRPDRPLVVQVTGTERQIESLRDAPLTAVVDLSQAQPGSHRYPIRLFPTRLRDLATNPRPTLSLEIEEMQSRSMRLEVEQRGRIGDPSVVLTDTVVDPKNVTIHAPVSVLRRIDQARVDVDLGRLDPTQREPMQEDVNVYDERGKLIPDVRIDPPFARVTPIFNPSAIQKATFVQPKFVGSLASGYVSPGFDTEPDHVSVSGSSEALANLSQVTTQPIDVTGLREDRIFFAPVKTPPGLSVKPALVRVRLMVRPAPPAGSKP